MGEVEGGRGWTEKKAAQQKNVRTGAISPQPCNAAETLGWIYNSFAGNERKGEVVKGGWGGWGGGGGVFDRDGRGAHSNLEASSFSEQTKKPSNLQTG